MKIKLEIEIEDDDDMRELEMASKGKDAYHVIHKILNTLLHDEVNDSVLREEIYGLLYKHGVNLDVLP